LGHAVRGSGYRPRGSGRSVAGEEANEAGRLGLDLGVSRAVLAEEDDLIGEGHGDEDVSALARIAKRRSVRP
jgi:hypothetical protein